MVGFFFVNSIFFVIFIKVFRGESRAAATFKMECFVIIVNGWKPLTIVTKHSILDAAATLDPPLVLHLGREAMLSAWYILFYCMPDHGKEFIAKIKRLQSKIKKYS